MAAANSSLGKEYEEVRSRFAGSSFMRITATTGVPPDSYEIEFHVKGMSLDDEGKAVVADRHKVKLVLPFGYPHFPPNCKPLTLIFHPDFDPDAICIGDFWSSSPSLGDLVVHIARLIAYQDYSTNAPFNPAALEWALANPELLPLDNTDFSAPTRAVRAEIGLESDASSAGKKPVNPDGEAGTGLPPVKEKKPFPAPAGEPAGEPKKDKVPQGRMVHTQRKGRVLVISAVVGLLISAIGGAMFFLDQRNYENAEQIWQGVPAFVGEYKFQEARNLLQSIDEQLDKVRFFNKTEKQALREKVKNMRGSDELKQESHGKVLLDGKEIGFSQNKDIQEVIDLLIVGEKLGGKGQWAEAVPIYEKAVEKGGALREQLPVPFTRIAELLLGSRVRAIGAEGDKHLSDKKWESALNSYEKALAFLDGQADGKWATEKKELLGRIDEARFAVFVDQGNQFFDAMQWNQAAESYEKAVLLARTGASDKLDDSAGKVEKKRDLARFNFHYEAAGKFFQEGQWDNAINSYKNCEQFFDSARAAGGVGEISLENIKRQIVVASVNSQKAAAASYLAEERYASANKALQKLIAGIDQSPFGADRILAAERKSAAVQLAKNNALTEIAEKKAFLEKNYEKIFRKHFSSSVGNKLSDPEVALLKDDGNILVFQMQCKEEIRNQKFTLEVIYQYDRRSGGWSSSRN